MTPPTTTPACEDSPDSWRHCWHYPRDMWARLMDEQTPPWTVTCCDCGATAEVRAVNRQAGTHGPHRTGEVLHLRRERMAPAVRVLRGGEA